MYTLVVLPGAKKQKRGFKNYLVVDSKDFTLAWCCDYIAGMGFTNIQIWATKENDATAFAISRLRSWDAPFTVLLTQSVWDGLEGYYLSHDVKPEDIEEVKSWCDIVEDINGSN